MKKTKWGIIGSCGIAKTRTVPGLKEAKNAVCEALMDINEQNLTIAAKEFGIKKTYTNIDDLLSDKDIDCVYIATPVFCHKEQVLKAAMAGKHILLEKPMGLTTAENREIKAICEKYGVKLSVGFMMRFHAAHQRIREIVLSGQIGEIISAYAKFNDWAPTDKLGWRGKKALSAGGTMMDMGIHCIDLLQYITNLKAVSACGECTNQLFGKADIDEASTAIMRMENGALFTVEANFNIPDSIGGCRFEIYGTKGRICAEGTIAQEEKGSVKITRVTDDKIVEEDMHYIPGNMYTKEIESFSDAILSNAEIFVKPDEAIFNQIIVEAIYESSGRKAVEV